MTSFGRLLFKSYGSSGHRQWLIARLAVIQYSWEQREEKKLPRILCLHPDWPFRNANHLSFVMDVAFLLVNQNMTERTSYQVAVGSARAKLYVDSLQTSIQDYRKQSIMKKHKSEFLLQSGTIQRNIYYHCRCCQTSESCFLFILIHFFSNKTSLFFFYALSLLPCNCLENSLCLQMFFFFKLNANKDLSVVN